MLSSSIFRNVPSGDLRSQGESDLDVHDFVHGIVEGVFSLIFPDPQARLQLGLRAISRAAHGGMAWYVWTTDRAGAYELALASDVADETAGIASLTLRYFPDPNEPVFGQFAPAEQAIRRSSLFDRTGTPAFDQAQELDPGLFCIGSITFAPEGSERFTLGVGVPNRWIEEAESAGEVSRQRDVPSAELALPLVNALVGGIVYLGRAAPASVRIWQRPGAVLRIHPDGGAHLHDDPLNVEWELEMSGLAMPGRSQGFDSAFANPGRAEPPWFSHASAVAPADVPWPVNPLWWRAAGWHFDPVGMFCGQCAAEEVAGHFHIHTHHCEDADHDHRT